MNLPNVKLRQTLDKKYNALMEALQANKEAMGLTAEEIDSADIIVDIYGRDAIKGPAPGEAKARIPFISHFKRCEVPYKKFPKQLVVILYGLGMDRSILFDKHHSLNGTYDATTTTPFVVEDPNDMAFFITKAHRNPELYMIVEPENYIEKVFGKLPKDERVEPTPPPATPPTGKKSGKK